MNFIKNYLMNFRKKHLSQLFVLLLSACLLLNSCANNENQTSGVKPEAQTQQQTENRGNASEKQFTLIELQEDFDEIKTTMEFFHPKLYTDVDELNALISSQYALLQEGMTAMQFYRVVAPIIAASRCGHTYINLSDEDLESFLNTTYFLPFSIYWQSNKALINQNALIPELPIGSQIVSIGGVDLESVIAGLAKNMASDGENLTQKIRAINDGFRYHYSMANDVPDELEIQYIGPDGGTQRSLVVKGVTKTEIEAAGDSIWGLMNQLSWQNSSSFEKDYALLRMASFYPSSGDTVDSYKTFIDDFFARVNQEKLNTIVIDLRDNFGGDPNVGAHLLSYLEKEPVPYFDEESGTYYPHLVDPVAVAENRFLGKVYVLINANCFSTTGHFLALLKYHHIGTMIGEETGGSFACSDASDSQNLTHTNLRFKSSRSIFRVVVEDLTPGRGIMPDYPVSPTLKELLDKKDVEMEKALELMGKQ